MNPLLNLVKYFTIFLLFLSFSYASQNGKNGSFDSAQISKGKTGKAPTQIRFAEGKEIALATFWDGYSKKFNLSLNDEFKSFKVFSDKIGQTHHRYKQYYKGLEVADMQYILHEKNGLVHLANGKTVHGLNINTSPTLNEAQALKKALNELGAEEYMWESSKNEMFKKELEQNKKATFYPTGQLVISSVGKRAEVNNFKLVYRFEIYAHKPSFAYAVDVDAHTGKILNKVSLILHGDVAGDGNSLYDGNVSITVSDMDYPQPPGPEQPEPHWQLDDWNAYDEEGVSWRPFNDSLGTNGGYNNHWYDIMDTDPVALNGSELQLSFYHRHSVEAAAGAEAPFDAWVGMNIRISTDGGETWSVLNSPSPAYDNSSLFSFGDIDQGFGEGPDIPGWTGLLNDWTMVTHDLSAYSGNTIQIRFAFASDPLFSTGNDGGGDDMFGWQVDNIEISNSETTLYSNYGDTATVSLSAIAKMPPGEVTEISGNYRLRESGRGNGIFTYKLFDSDFFIDAVDFVDDDSSFTDSTDSPGVSIHWSLENTYDYFLDIHGRDSYDDAGGRMKSYYINNYANASWRSDNLMQFGDNLGTNPFVSLDIVSHELTHGVVQYTAGLTGGQAGPEASALNESFCDIFAMAISFWIYGEVDWINNAGDQIIRSMSDPRSNRGYPDTYQGDGWDPAGEEHVNSTVQSHWFYLLVEGGSGTNDNGFTYDIQGIGFDDAEQIAYRNLSIYLTPTSEYIDAREGSLNAARDLFGSNSQQFLSTKAAWNAVGVSTTSFLISGANIDRNYFSAGSSSANISASIDNPDDIYVEVNAIIENTAKTVSDTIPMFDDGAHNDNAANDDVYGTSWAVPEGQDFYSVSVQVFSPDSNYAILVRDLQRFTTVGPVVLESFSQTTSDTVIYPGDTKRFNFYIQNNSPTDSIFNITSKSRALDTCALTIAFNDPVYGDIAPGANVKSSRSTSILFYDYCPANTTIPFVVEVYSDDYLFWVDTFYISTDSILVAIEDQFVKPLEFGLKQNYPNPFNPQTIINYSLKKAGKVELAVYDVTGKLIKALVSGNQASGEYSVVFDGLNLPSGVYFYRIKSGKFEQSRKMILLK